MKSNWSFWVLFISVILFSTIHCSQNEKPGTAFRDFTGAVCKGDFSTAISRVDVNAMAVSFFKAENKGATEEDVKKYKTSPKFVQDAAKFREGIKKTITQKTDSPLCKMKVVNEIIEGTKASIVVLEEPDDPYSKFSWIMEVKDKKWVLSGVGDNLINALEVTDSALANFYDGNIVAADEKYKNKIVRVTGNIHSIGKDVAGRVYVALGAGMIGTVQGYIHEPFVKKIAELKKGDRVVITGICAGKLLNISVNDCVVHKL